MIEIKLLDDYYITTDAYNYILSKRRKKKTKKGAVAYDHLAYRNTISGVLDSFRRIYPQQCDEIKSMKQLITVLSKLDEKFEEIMKELKEDKIERCIESWFMCEYCEKSKYLIDEEKVKVIICNGNLIIHTELGNYCNTKLQCCPFCGRGFDNAQREILPIRTL